MTTYVQHKWANSRHIVHRSFENGSCLTFCGKFYTANQSFQPGLSSYREEEIVCAECRRRAAHAAGKKLYHQPSLRYGLSMAKRRHLDGALKAHQERQRLAAWNKAAQEATR